MRRLARNPAPLPAPNAPDDPRRAAHRLTLFVALSLAAHGGVIALAAAWVTGPAPPRLSLPAGAARDDAVGDLAPATGGVRITMVPAPPAAATQTPPTNEAAPGASHAPMHEPSSPRPPVAPSPELADAVRDLAATLMDRIQRFEPAAMSGATRPAAAAPREATPPRAETPPAGDLPTQPAAEPPTTRAGAESDSGSDSGVDSGGDSGGVEGPVALSSNASPRYPTEARRRRAEGVVTLALVVGPDGAVETATVGVSSGHPVLDAAALDAARTWRFAPGRVGGVPVRCAVTAPVRFRLHRRPADPPG